jgi:hypothetical protein
MDAGKEPPHPMNTNKKPKGTMRFIKLQAKGLIIPNSPNSMK